MPVDLPADNEDPYGDKLRTAIWALEDRIAALEGGSSGIPATQDKAEADYAISDPTNDRVGIWDITDDATPTANWPDRLGFKFNGVRTGGFNEYGEGRFDAAKSATVALRAHGHVTGGTADSTQDILQVREGRGVGDVLLGVARSGIAMRRDVTVTGNLTADNMTGVVALADGASSAGLPAGTIVVRYTTP